MLEPKTARHFRYELSVMLKAAADQDPEGFAEVAGMLREAADEGLREAAAAQRERHGYSWAAIGRAFGVTAWAAQKRLGAKTRGTDDDAVAR